MAIFSIEISDGDVNRVIESLCTNYGWKETIEDPDNPAEKIPNPETKYVFANRMVRQFLVEHVTKYEIDQARNNLDSIINTPVINDPQL